MESPTARLRGIAQGAEKGGVNQGDLGRPYSPTHGWSIKTIARQTNQSPLSQSCNLHPSH
jgi:DNA-binding phage protein